MTELDEIRTSSQSIVTGRLLLDSTDHLPPLVKQCAQILRTTVTAAHQDYASCHASCRDVLEASDSWKKLMPEQRDSILVGEGIVAVPLLDLSTDERLVQTLQSTPVAWWHDKTAALPGRFQNAAARAAKLLTPKAQKAVIPSRTLHSAADLEDWVAEVRKEIEAKLREGPVIV